ncbi:transmembrane protein, partial [Cystoisospora suis]
TLSLSFFSLFCLQVWNLTLALFGDLGYSGIAGLIVGAFALLTSFLSFLLFFLHTGPAHLFDVSERYISTSRVRESPLLRLATSRRLQDEGGEGERGTFRSGVITLKSSFWRRDKTLSPEQNNTDGGAGEEGEDESDDQKKKETTQKKETLKKMNSSSFLSDDKKDEGDEKTKEEEGTKENREMKGIKEEEENPDDKDDVDGESSGQRGAGAGGGGE